MAITRLTDIITVFDSKWTYGDVKFGYDGEVNQDHDTQYPLMLVNPPESIIPQIYNGREEYSFEINFYNLYSQSAQSVVTLQERWDNLQDLSNEWLDLVLKKYQDVTVEAYLNDESVEIERLKDVANDKLVQIKLTFTMSAFTKCFRPVSSYPTDFTGLSSWLRADSNVTFNIPTKKVSAIGDSSGNSNGISSQSNTSLEPIRQSYGGGSLDKTMITFNGDVLVSDNNFVTGKASTQEFTIIEVSKINKVDNTVFGYFYLNDGSYISIGTNSIGNYKATISDGTTELTATAGENALDKYHIGVIRKENKSMKLQYRSGTGFSLLNAYDAAFALATSFENEKFRIGCTTASDGASPGPSAINTEFIDGDFQEIIMYDRKLTDLEVAKIEDYLNKKYRIY